MIKSKKDLYSGLMFIALGGFFALWAGNYPMGSSVRMGPAYFPTILGWLTAGLGVIIALRGFTVADEAPSKTQVRPLVLILASAVLFGLFMDVFSLGFVAAVFAATYVCALGGYEFRWKEGIIEGVILVVVCWGMFVWALGLPFRLFPWS
jgi:Tripartite tricarboxylate transporter TctB family